MSVNSNFRSISVYACDRSNAYLLIEQAGHFRVVWPGTCVDPRIQADALVSAGVLATENANVRCPFSLARAMPPAAFAGAGGLRSDACCAGGDCDTRRRHRRYLSE